ncbi:stage III sporulation protein SpoIIIAB [Aneurinibacillus tyrosinisolvens]|uniref:stage III sporulation protein SpoIIIAB n=1 Tax=Aneurinibacillus tyrosinisolvens TaxID=1443435 RepID=UPI000B2CEDC4|nr:stage III sporulation protein SpoIIIAB [Aneurinibacillus tyrosinisolvens]
MQRANAMLKLLGASAVLLSGTLIGMRMAGRFAKRPLQIRQLRMGLQILETEIVYGSTPLHLALHSISRRVQGDVARLFARTSEMLEEQADTTEECWRKAVNEVWPATALKEPEKEVLLHLGGILGRSDREDQQKHLKLTVINLQSEENNARDSQKKYEKVCKSLGILGGLLIVILLY